MKRLIMVLLAGLILNGCASGELVSNMRDTEGHGDIWYHTKRLGGDDKLYYCQANKDVDQAHPVCVEARVER